VYHGYGNSSAPSREYNVVIDIPASQRMYSAEWLSPLLMAPLDTSGLLRCGAPEFSDLIAANNSAHPYAQVLIKNYDIWSHSVPTNSSVSDVLYDAQAAFSMLYYSRQWAQGAPPAVPGLSFQVLPIVRVRDAGRSFAQRAARRFFSPRSPPPISPFLPLPLWTPAVCEQQRLYSDRPCGAHGVDRDAISLWPAECHAHHLPRPDRLNHRRALKPRGGAQSEAVKVAHQVAHRGRCHCQVAARRSPSAAAAGGPGAAAAGGGGGWPRRSCGAVILRSAQLPERNCASALAERNCARSRNSARCAPSPPFFLRSPSPPRRLPLGS
jgi:hypothetical protein